MIEVLLGTAAPFSFPVISGVRRGPPYRMRYVAACKALAQVGDSCRRRTASPCSLEQHHFLRLLLQVIIPGIPVPWRRHTTPCKSDDNNGDAVLTSSLQSNFAPAPHTRATGREPVTTTERMSCCTAAAAWVRPVALHGCAPHPAPPQHAACSTHSRSRVATFYS